MDKTLTTVTLLLIGLFANAQQADVVKFNTYEQLRQKRNDTTYIINFWATWCVPCVKEIPYFEQFYQNYKNEKLKIVLFSVDFEKDYDNKLLPFIKQRNIQSTVHLLNEPDNNTWFAKVDKTWGGNIPATVVFNNKTGFKYFRAYEFTYQELEEIVKPQVCQ